MTGCSVPGCKSRSESGLVFKRLPANSKMRALWLKKMAEIEFAPNQGARICEKHFCSSQWGVIGSERKRILKFDAVPTIFSVNY